MLKLHPAAGQPGLIAAALNRIGWLVTASGWGKLRSMPQLPPRHSRPGIHAEDDESGDGAILRSGMDPRLRGDDCFKCNDGTAG
jgi:hypothetical protein